MGRRRGPGPDSAKDRDGGDDAGGAAGGPRSARSAIPPPALRPGAAVAGDRAWRPELRAALGWAAGLLAVMQLVDLANGTLTPGRGVCWTSVALVLFAVLYPARVTAGPHWLASRGLLRTQRVHTDLLVLVRRSDGVAPRLVLRDALGGRVEIDTRTLTANPLLWHLLDQGVRLSRERGLLRCGAGPLQELADRIDGAGARAVFEASGLLP
ncbi:hypothetical protein [Streptomyces albospinus]|nr:hypothetical protein [Streptomyces albospinus]